MRAWLVGSALIGSLSCAGPRESTSAVTPRPSSSTPSMPSFVSELCDWLTRAPRAAQDTAHRLGVVESESASALYVKPHDAAFARAIVSRGDGAPPPTAYVELQLATPGAVTVADLTRAFGAHRTPPSVGADAAPAIHFTVDRGADHPLTCLVVAKAAADDASVEDGTIHELGVRVDPRL